MLTKWFIPQYSQSRNSIIFAVVHKVDMSVEKQDNLSIVGSDTSQII